MTPADKFIAEVKARTAPILSAEPIPQRSGWYCKAPEGWVFREHEVRLAKAANRLVAMVEKAIEAAKAFRQQAKLTHEWEWDQNLKCFNKGLAALAELDRIAAGGEVG